MTFDEHRNGFGSLDACKQCKRYHKTSAPTLALLCLAGTALWKEENTAVVKRIPKPKGKFEGNHGWDVLDRSGHKLSRVFDARSAAEEFAAVAIASGHEFAYVRQLHPKTLPEDERLFA